MSKRRFISRKRPQWFNLFGPARKNKKNRAGQRTVRASPPPKITRSHRRNKRQAIAKLAGKIPQPVAHGRHRSRYWRRLEMRKSRRPAA